MRGRRKLFISEYLRDFNATQAAIRAGYSVRSARQVASRLLTNDDIKEEVTKGIAERTMGAEETCLRLGEIARAEWTKYLTKDGVDMVKLLADKKQHLVKGMKQDRYGTVIEFHSALEALALIAKHHKLLVDRQEVDHNVDGTLVVTFKSSLPISTPPKD